MQNHKSNRSLASYASPNALLLRSRLCKICSRPYFNEDHSKCIASWQKQCDAEARKAKEGRS